MDLLWPGFLALLVLIPAAIGAYILMLRRRRRFTIRYSSLSLVREAVQKQSWLRRHLPFALFTLALTSLIIALVRPVAIVSVPYGQSTIVLSIDVSRSMCSIDIEPSRLEAAQAAAISFIGNQKAGTQFGIVAFAGFAEVIQTPTDDQEVLQSAVESLLTGQRTAIGSGILKAIDVISEIDPNVAASITDRNRATAVEPQPVPKGAYVPEIIVLLTDGASNAGPMPVDAARQAADRGIRVYTIGFGTERGAQFPRCGRQFEGREPFSGGQFGGGGGGGGGGGRFRRGIDEETLKQVADITGAEYYSAESAGELQQVFEKLPTYLITKHETTELSVVFAALGALLALLAIGLSLLWNPLS